MCLNECLDVPLTISKIQEDILNLLGVTAQLYFTLAYFGFQINVIDFGFGVQFGVSDAVPSFDI